MSLRRLNPTTEFKTVSIQDSAIDKEATSKENLEKFEESHEMSLLTLKANEKPTYFIIKNIDPEKQLEIQEDHYKMELPEIDKKMTKAEIKELKPKMKQEKPGQMLIKYFKAGCNEVEEDGKRTACNTSEWPLNVLQELGGFIMSRGVLGEEEKKS